MTPIELLTDWVDDEKKAGAAYAQHAVLSSQALNGSAHGRVVAIREMTAAGILFFTQARTRKVAEMQQNPRVSLTFWLERHTREVMVEGEARFLTPEQNADYWASYPQWAQLRFCSYAPTSGEPIEDKRILEEKRLALQQTYQGQPLPCSPDYCGVTIKPQRFVFYQYRSDELSDVWEHVVSGDGFQQQRLSP